MNKLVVLVRAKHGPHVVAFELDHDEVVEMCKQALEKTYSLKIEDSSRIFFEVINDSH